MLSHDFAPIELDDQAMYQDLWAACPCRAADYSFVNLWGWAKPYGLTWKLDDGLVWIKQSKYYDDMCEQPYFWAPVGEWSQTDFTNMPCLASGAELIRVPEALTSVLSAQMPGRVVVTSTEDQWEYVYLQEELAVLPGNKFHKKRNHVNQFEKLYGMDYRSFTPDRIEEALLLQEEWCRWRECNNSPSLLAESDVTHLILRYWDAFPQLVGGALYVKDVMAAFSVGEALSDDMFVVHFEKGRPEFRGVYQAMNATFATHAGASFVFVNREQDAGEEGLRKAKKSYLPNHFLRKDSVRIAKA